MNLTELERKAKLERKAIVRRIDHYELILKNNVGVVRKKK